MGHTAEIEPVELARTRLIDRDGVARRRRERARGAGRTGARAADYGRDDFLRVRLHRNDGAGYGASTAT